MTSVASRLLAEILSDLVPERIVAVLIVGCPYALIRAVPTATLATIDRAACAGILVKGGQHIESVALADTISFDKTGTLTEGNPRVNAIKEQGSTPFMVYRDRKSLCRYRRCHGRQRDRSSSRDRRYRLDG
jgi:cation transport ATPase